MKIAVIGAGSWGTAIASTLVKKGHETILWAREPDVVQGINTDHRNPVFLSDVVVPAALAATGDVVEALQGAEVAVFVVPSHAMRTVVRTARPALEGAITLLSLTKGIEEASLMRMSEVIKSEVGPSAVGRLAVLSGPNHAEEVIREIPSATVVAADDPVVARMLQEAFMTPFFRVYTNTDTIGVELAGATKNIVAIAAGMSDGLGFGDNTKASLMTRGLAEITRLGVVMGASPLTFSGLAGVGDLVVTCFSRLSRNRSVGECIAKGRSLAQISRETRMVAEGVHTTRAVHELAPKVGVDMPITDLVYAVLYEGKSAGDCVQALMTRAATEEVKEIFSV